MLEYQNMAEYDLVTELQWKIQELRVELNNITNTLDEHYATVLSVRTLKKLPAPPWEREDARKTNRRSDPHAEGDTNTSADRDFCCMVGARSVAEVASYIEETNRVVCDVIPQAGAHVFIVGRIEREGRQYPISFLVTPGDDAEETMEKLEALPGEGPLSEELIRALSLHAECYRRSDLVQVGGAGHSFTPTIGVLELPIATSEVRIGSGPALISEQYRALGRRQPRFTWAVNQAQIRRRRRLAARKRTVPTPD